MTSLPYVGGAAAVLAVVGVMWWWRTDDGRGLSEEEAEAVVADYLDAVEQQDYREAARFLAGGSAGDRPDLAPLVVDDPTVDGIAAGLAEYCREGCLSPTAMAVEAEGDHYVVVVTFGEPRGHPLQRTFVVGEGADVRGLPPAGTGTLAPT
jgi:hypothetical protein